MIKYQTQVISFIVIFLFCCCAVTISGKTNAKTLYKDVLITDVPHVQQKNDFCGEACAEMYLKKRGNNYTQDEVFNLSGLDPLNGRGCYTSELAVALKNIGFDTGNNWFFIDSNDSSKQIEMQFQDMYDDLVSQIPSIVCMHYDETPQASEHFRLIVGYDSKSDEMIYQEPADSNAEYKKMGREKFIELWPLKYEKDKWTLIRLRMKPDKIRKIEFALGFTDADYAQHIMGLKKLIPNSNFTIIMQKPFVVIGDEPPQTVRERSIRTVKWAVDKLKQDYFTNDPCSIIDIWLFKDDKSYRKYSKEIFGDNPTTPFGYFSSTHNALIMNIATGGGTLVHEIVHPFMAANFPECPAWFNEGLASLYEQSSERDGKIIGLTNWRLAGLQGKIRNGKLPSFEKLINSTSSGFYGGSIYSDNYAQARYLCYYLQEKNLLTKFYNQFVNDVENDPSGYKTLQKVLNNPNMQKFQKEWEQWVLKLSFP